MTVWSFLARAAGLIALGALIFALGWLHSKGTC
jgi:hypothetical protein